MLARDEISCLVSSDAWGRAVVNFNKQMYGIYEASGPKIPVLDDFEREGWAAFWREWELRMQKAETGE